MPISRRQSINFFVFATLVMAASFSVPAMQTNYQPTWATTGSAWATGVLVTGFLVLLASKKFSFRIGQSDVAGALDEPAFIAVFLCLSGRGAVAAVLVGSLISYRRQPAAKIAFNVVMNWIGIVPFLWVSAHSSLSFRMRHEVLLVGAGIGARFAISTFGLWWLFGRLGLRTPDFWRAQAWSLIPALAGTSASVLAVALIRNAPWALFGWAAWLGITLFLYLFSARASEKLLKVEELMDFNDGLAVAKDLSGMGTAARHMIRAQYAEVIVVESPSTVMRSAADPVTGEPVSVLVATDELPLNWQHVLKTAEAVHTSDCQEVRWLAHPSTGDHEMLVVPFTSATGQTLGLLVCADPENRGNRFTDDEFTLLKRLAVHAAIWMQSEHNALHDPLTGLANRRLLSNHVDSALGLGAVGALLMMDLNSFKAINDTHGHGAGDEVLVAQAGRLRSIVGAGGVVARLGGDEFAVWTSVPDPAALAHLIGRQLSEPIAIGTQTVVASASIGVALAPLHAKNCSELMWHADSAMFTAKRSASHVKVVSEDDLVASARSRQLRQDVADAVDSGQITVAYQPIVELHNRRIIGFEALARWEHPTLGPVSPDDFIPIVKDAGRLHRLTLNALEQALVARHEWEAISGRPITVNVNLDPSSLAEESLVDDVSSLLTKTHTGPDRLNLEIIEAALGRFDRTYLLHCLRELGVGVVIDDFGTGHSTLHRIAQLPVSGIKLDRTFADLTKPLNPEIVSITVNIAKGKGARLTVEGIETLGDAQHMLFLGATHAQGYFFGKAIPQSLVLDTLARHQASPPPPLSADNVLPLRTH
jgi:diguanylate cyclase